MVHPSFYSLSVALGLAACASHDPEPLRPELELATVLADLQAKPDDVSLPEAVQLLLRHNSRVVAAIGHWREQRALADVDTPLSNPSIGVGPVYLSGGTWGFEAGLGWLLPAFGKRAILDDLDAASAEAARITAIAVAREEYLQLRADLLMVALLTDREILERANLAVLRGIVDGQRRLGANATITALDLRLLELEWRSLESETRGTVSAVASARGVPAIRCGVDPGRVAKLPMQARPSLPKQLPSLAQLRELVPEHPRLASLRTRYEVAEQQLRLELRRQYPDLEIGGSLEREGGGSRFALPLGIRVPLFDGNEGPIAQALAVREAVRAEYRATMRRQLNRIAVVRGALELQHARYREFADQVAQITASARELIEVSVRAGRLDANDRALALRKVHAAELSLIEARADLYNEWVRLESACGAPLLRFPGQPNAPSRLPNGAEVR